MKADFLPNKPLGVDLLDGQSQNRVADAIKKHIEEIDAEKGSNNAFPRIIGVEGAWGSGKSNMLLSLQNLLASDYYFFTYDAWGNQEDLQRRSILEQLTDELIQKEQLVKETEITILDTDLDHEPTVKKCSWKRRLFALVARKSTTHDITIPKMESSTKAFALMLLITAIIPTVMDAMKPDNASWWYFIVTLLATFLPFIVFCFLKRRNKWKWSDMWKMYHTEGKTDTSTYTISELEPSVTEFRKWLNDLADSLMEGMHLVIVFDNMDRLPREKVRQLWSSIQTFFAGREYNKVWCIVPFDRDRLANAFADEDVDEKHKLHLTNYFIEKTFPVVYRIPVPIITDYRGVFQNLFNQAFGARDEQDLINRCYRLKHPKPNMREMISFINKCVSQCHTWGDEIRLTSIALFELNKDIILENKTPDEAILSGDYIKGFAGIIEIDENLPVEMSSLVYVVSKNKSAQLPLKNVTEKALLNNDVSNFDVYAKEQPEFYVILDEVTSGMDPSYLDNAINHISKINKNNVVGEKLHLLNKIWTRLGGMYLKRTQNETSFRNEVKLLINNSYKQEEKENIANKFIGLFTTDEKNQHKGKEWFVTYKEFDAYTKEGGVNVQLPDTFLKADIFVDYILSARDEYINYPIFCDNTELSDYVAMQIEEGVDLSEAMKLLKADARYSFNDLFIKARGLVENKSAKDGNIEAVLNMCKVLSDGPLKLNVTLPYLDSLSHEGAVLSDLQILRALEGKEINGKDGSYYDGLAEISYRYTDTYGIWKKTLSSKTIVMKNIMSSLIVNNNHHGNLDEVKDVLTEMSNIKTLTNVDCGSLIRFVNDCGKINLNDLEKKVPLSDVFSNETWCKALLLENCPLSNAILEKFYHDFNSRPLNEFLNSNNAWVSLTQSYWLRVLSVLIDSDEFKSVCSEKLVEIAEHIIDGVSAGNINDRNENIDLQSKILSWVEYDNVSSKVIDVMAKFGVQHTMTVFKFKTLHHYLEKTRNYETQYLNYVLKPIIDMNEVQTIVYDNKEFYEPLLRANLDQASDLKRKMITAFENSTHGGFKEMIKGLNILPNEDSTNQVS